MRQAGAGCPCGVAHARTGLRERSSRRRVTCRAAVRASRRRWRRAARCGHRAGPTDRMPSVPVRAARARIGVQGPGGAGPGRRRAGCRAGHGRRADLTCGAESSADQVRRAPPAGGEPPSVTLEVRDRDC